MKNILFVLVLLGSVSSFASCTFWGEVYFNAICGNFSCGKGIYKMAQKKGINISEQNFQYYMSVEEVKVGRKSKKILIARDINNNSIVAQKVIHIYRAGETAYYNTAAGLSPYRISYNQMRDFFTLASNELNCKY